MQFRKRVLSLTILLALILSACSSAAATPAAMNEAMPQATEAMMDESTQSSQMGADSMSMDDQAMSTESAMNESSSAAMGSDSMMGDSSNDAMSSANNDSSMTNDHSGDATGSDSMMSGDSSGMMESPAWISASLTNAATGESFSVSDFNGKVVLVETMAIWCSNCLQQQRQVKELHNLLGMRDDFISLGLDVDPNENAQSLKEYTAKNSFDWTYAVSPTDVSRELGQLYTDQFLNPTSTPMLIIDRHGAAHPLPFGIKSAADLQSALEPFLNEGM